MLAAACTQQRLSYPERTATEQLMFSAAVERVCDALALKIPPESKIYLDASYVEGADSKYLLATLRNRILRRGGRLVAERALADLVFEPRVGALSVDRKETLVGVPGFSVPVPLAGSFKFPDLALFKSDRQQGVVKLALSSYDAKTGGLHSSLDPVYAFSRRTDWTVLFVIGWQTNDLMPPPESEDWIGKATYN